MKIAIIGAGLLGLFTARRLLAESGHQIHVFERREGPGLETSFANGALLHPSAVEPWNSPGIARTLFKSLGDEHSAVLLRARALPSLWRWGWRFVRESNAQRWRQHTFDNVALALHSVALMQQVREQGIAYGAAPLGTLSVYRDATALEAASRWAAALAEHGVPWQRVTRDEVLSLEPALAASAAGGGLQPALIGGVHATGDESGDAHRFCSQVQPWLAQRGVQFHFNAQVLRLHLGVGAGGAPVVRGLVLAGADGAAEFDAVVLAAGPWSTKLASTVGLRLPVQPAKGYSVTFDLPAQGVGERADEGAARGAAVLPSRPVIDPALHIAVVPVVGGRLRVAGTAEFCGFDARVDAARVANLLRQLARLFPRVAEASVCWPRRDWAGLRPLCADGCPLIGPTRLPGLWLNTGHGQLGWTTGAASADVLASLMAGRLPAVPAQPFAPARFEL